MRLFVLVVGLLAVAVSATVLDDVFIFHGDVADVSPNEATFCFGVTRIPSDWRSARETTTMANLEIELIPINSADVTEADRAVVVRLFSERDETAIEATAERTGSRFTVIIDVLEWDSVMTYLEGGVAAGSVHTAGDLWKVAEVSLEMKSASFNVVPAGECPDSVALDPSLAPTSLTVVPESAVLFVLPGDENAAAFCAVLNEVPVSDGQEQLFVHATFARRLSEADAPQNLVAVGAMEASIGLFVPGSAEEPDTLVWFDVALGAVGDGQLAGTFEALAAIRAKSGDAAVRALLASHQARGLVRARELDLLQLDLVMRAAQFVSGEGSGACVWEEELPATIPMPSALVPPRPVLSTSFEVEGDGDSWSEAAAGFISLPSIERPQVGQDGSTTEVHVADEGLGGDAYADDGAFVAETDAWVDENEWGVNDALADEEATTYFIEFTIPDLIESDNDGSKGGSSDVLTTVLLVLLALTAIGAASLVCLLCSAAVLVARHRRIHLGSPLRCCCLCSDHDDRPSRAHAPPTELRSVVACTGIAPPANVGSLFSHTVAVAGATAISTPTAGTIGDAEGDGLGALSPVVLLGPFRRWLRVEMPVWVRMVLRGGEGSTSSLSHAMSAATPGVGSDQGVERHAAREPHSTGEPVCAVSGMHV